MSKLSWNNINDDIMKAGDILLAEDLEFVLNVEKNLT